MYKEKQEFTWQGIQIEVVFESEYFRGMAHIAVRSIRPERAPLPISETGYRSHFMPMDQPQDFDVVAWVISELDQAALSPVWRKHLERSRQGELF